MSRLPELERILHETAERLDQMETQGQAVRSARRSAGLALVLTLVTSGAALGTAALLETGDPVPPPGREKVRKVESVTPVLAGSWHLLPIRVADPEGGPSWGLASFRRRGSGHPQPPPMVCLTIGRVDSGRLGVVGRDGVFGNDGRFHRVSASSDHASTCAGAPAEQSTTALYPIATGPFLLPASGVVHPTTRTGGCLTSHQLADVARRSQLERRYLQPCPPRSLRIVTAGLAGPGATRITLTMGQTSRTLRPDRHTDGAYLFVSTTTTRTAPASTLIIRYRNGRLCRRTTPAWSRRPSEPRSTCAGARPRRPTQD